MSYTFNAVSLSLKHCHTRCGVAQGTKPDTRTDTCEPTAVNTDADGQAHRTDGRAGARAELAEGGTRTAFVWEDEKFQRRTVMTAV